MISQLFLKYLLIEISCRGCINRDLFPLLDKNTAVVQAVQNFMVFIPGKLSTKDPIEHDGVEGP